MQPFKVRRVAILRKYWACFYRGLLPNTWLPSGAFTISYNVSWDVWQEMKGFRKAMFQVSPSYSFIKRWTIPGVLSVGVTPSGWISISHLLCSSHAEQTSPAASATDEDTGLFSVQLRVKRLHCMSPTQNHIVVFMITQEAPLHPIAGDDSCIELLEVVDTIKSMYYAKKSGKSIIITCKDRNINPCMHAKA